MSVYIDSKRIQKFVTRVEKKKGYKRDAGLILRHLFEEVGELSRAVWLHENKYPKHLVARELVDVISLCVYIADVVGVDLDESFPKIINEVAKRYGVRGTDDGG